MAKYVITSDTGVFVLHPTDTYSAVTSIDCNKGNVTFEFPTQETNPTKKLGGYVTDDSIYWSETDLRWKGDEVENSAITSFNGDVFNITNSNWDYMFAFCPNMTTIDFGENSTAITSMHSVLYKNSGMTSWTNLNFPNVTNTEQAFYGNVNLTNFDFNSTPNSENAIKMLGYTSLESADTTPMTNVKRMDYMLMGCYKLKDATLDINKCESLSHTFVGCESLSGLTLLNDNGTVKVLHNIFNSQGDGGYWQLELGSDRNILNSPRVKEFRLNGASLENINGAFGRQNELDHNGNECYCPIEVVDLGVCPNLKTFGASPFSHCYNLREITMKNSDNITSCTSLFADGCNSLTSVTLGTWRNLTDTAINANSMFANCPSLNESGIDLYMPNNMTATQMFSGCTSLTSWDLSAHTPNVTNAEKMFVGCVGLTSFDIPTMPQLTKTNSMFSGCTNLTACTIADNPILKEISYMFNGCTNLKSVSIGNCPSATTLTATFSGCNNLTSVTIDNVASIGGVFSGNTSIKNLTLNNGVSLTAVSKPMSSSIENVVLNNCSVLANIDNMCKGCGSLSSFTMNNLDKVTSSQWVFSGCSALKDLNLGSMPIVTNTQGMFVNCTALTSVEMTTPMNVNTTNMFSGCSSLSSVTLNGVRKFNSNMFSGCPSLEIVDFGECPYLSGGSFMNNTTIKSVTMKNCNTILGLTTVFQGCTSLQSVDFGTNGFPSLSASTKMFSGATALTSVNMGSCPNLGKPSYNASGVPTYTSLADMFTNCYSLTSVTLTDLDNIAQTTIMFKGCSALTELNLGNVPNLGTVYMDASGGVKHASVANMFSGCSNLSSVTFNGADNMVNATSLFNACSGLKSFSISGFAKLNNTTSMFANCPNLESVDLGYCPQFGVNYTNESGKTSNLSASKMFSGCTSLKSFKIQMPNATALTNTDMFVGCTALESVDFGSCSALTNLGAIFVATNTNLKTITINDCEGISAKTIFGATLTAVTDIYMSGLTETAQASIKAKNTAKVPNATWHFE